VLRGDEVGRDGCGLHRFVGTQGVAHQGVDAVSLEEHRRYRPKPARLEGHPLLTMLRRHIAGARQVWSVGRVPSVAEEDRRQLH
jgi:hypothetical protein